MTDHETEDPGVKSEPLTARKRREKRQNFCLLAGKKKVALKKKTIEGTDMLLDLWLDETIQFALTNTKTSKEMREVYDTLLVSKHMVKLGSVQHIRLPLKIVVDRCQTAREK